jgi:hypothetical protein
MLYGWVYVLKKNKKYDNVDDDYDVDDGLGTMHSYSFEPGQSIQRVHYYTTFCVLKALFFEFVLPEMMGKFAFGIYHFDNNFIPHKIPSMNAITETTQKCYYFYCYSTG